MLRGQHYILADILLTTTYPDEQEAAQNVPIVFEYLKLHLRLVVRYLEILPTLYKDVIANSFLNQKKKINKQIFYYFKYYRGLQNADLFL
jgi:hypothetical protein